MRLSNLLGRTLRDVPAEAEHVGHQLVLRAGLARAIAPGSYALLPLGMAVARRIEAIMHAEMARAGAQEFRTPVVQPAALWEASGRYARYGPLMLRAADRAARPLVVAPTHEEAVAELARREVGSYRQLPALIYQVHTKYRDELRSRGGLMRMREFTMLDAYSLDADLAGLDRSYQLVADAFERILSRCGLEYISVEASAGEMGGGETREYMALSASGEDMLARCASCGYAANAEVARARRTTNDQRPTINDENYQEPVVARSSFVVGHIEEIATPDTATIADLAALLGVPESATAKAVFFDTPERGLLFAVIRGDLEVSEPKLMAAAGVSELRPAAGEQIVAAGAVPGYASPVGLTVAEGDGPGVFVLADPSVAEGTGGFVAGANRAGYHLRNVAYGRDWRATQVADIASVRAGDPCPRCGAPLALERGIEIGHIFKLGDRYARALGASYLAEDGVARPVVMGSYGLGVERLIQIIVEQHHDEAGIVWPASVAPADVHLIALGKGESPRAAAEGLLAELEAAGLRVLYDDRAESAGVKFNDADLIGLPARLVVSERLLAAGELELKPRGGEVLRAPRGEIMRRLRALLVG